MDPKDRVSTLLRSPSEDSASALEAAELIAANGLSIKPVPDTDKKRTRAANLVQKLLRTAASTSGASDNERQIAAQHASTLFVEHGLELVSAPKKRSKPIAPREPVIITAEKRQCRKERTPFAVWKSVITEEAHYCIQCGWVIYADEIAWFDAWYGYIHSNIPVG